MIDAAFCLEIFSRKDTKCGGVQAEKRNLIEMAKSEYRAAEEAGFCRKGESTGGNF